MMKLTDDEIMVLAGMAAKECTNFEHTILKKFGMEDAKNCRIVVPLSSEELKDIMAFKHDMLSIFRKFAANCESLENAYKINLFADNFDRAFQFNLSEKDTKKSNYEYN